MDAGRRPVRRGFPLRVQERQHSALLAVPRQGGRVQQPGGGAIRRSHHHLLGGGRYTAKTQLASGAYDFDFDSGVDDFKLSVCLCAEPSRGPTRVRARSLSASEAEVLWKALPWSASKKRVLGYEVRDGDTRDLGIGTKSIQGLEPSEACDATLTA